MAPGQDKHSASKRRVDDAGGSELEAARAVRLTLARFAEGQRLAGQVTFAAAAFKAVLLEQLRAPVLPLQSARSQIANCERLACSDVYYGVHGLLAYSPVPRMVAIRLARMVEAANCGKDSGLFSAQQLTVGCARRCVVLVINRQPIRLPRAEERWPPVFWRTAELENLLDRRRRQIFDIRLE